MYTLKCLLAQSAITTRVHAILVVVDKSGHVKGGYEEEGVQMPEVGRDQVVISWQTAGE